MRSGVPCALSRAALCACVLLLAPAVHADNFDIYSFDSPEQQARFEALTQELRCPKCQNNNLADSTAPIAKDLRQRTYELVKAGKSDEEIVAYLKARYGDFITYRPPLNLVTILLWTGPFLLLAIAVPLLVLRLRRQTTADAPATPDEARVRDILARYDTPRDDPPDVSSRLAGPAAGPERRP